MTPRTADGWRHPPFLPGGREALAQRGEERRVRRGARRTDGAPGSPADLKVKVEAAGLRFFSRVG